MNFVDYIILGVIAAVIGAAAWYVRSAKKKGKKCIGCPDDCPGNCAGCSGSCANCGGEE